MIVPAREARLLHAYTDCLHPNRPATTAARSARLAIYSTAPPEPPAAGWRHASYHVAGRFAHLTAVHRFVTDIRALL